MPPKNGSLFVGRVEMLSENRPTMAALGAAIRDMPQVIRTTPITLPAVSTGKPVSSRLGCGISDQQWAAVVEGK